MLLTRMLRAGAGISELTQPLFRLGCPRRLMSQVGQWERKDGFIIRNAHPVRIIATVEPGAPATAAAITPGTRYRGFRSTMAFGAAGAMGLVRRHRLHDSAQLFDSLNICAPSLVPLVFGVPCRPNSPDLTVLEKIAAGFLFASCIGTFAGLLGTRQTALSDYVTLDEQIEWLDHLRRRGVLGLLGDRLERAASCAEEQGANTRAVALLLTRLIIEVPIQAGLLISGIFMAALATTGALLGASYCTSQRACLATGDMLAKLRSDTRPHRISFSEAEEYEGHFRAFIDEVDPRLRQLETTIKQVWGGGAWARAVAKARWRDRGPRVIVKNAGPLFGHLFANQLLSNTGEKINRQLLFGRTTSLPLLKEPDFLEQLDFFFHFAVAHHAFAETIPQAEERDVAELLNLQARTRGEIRAHIHARRLERNERENEQSTHLIGRDARTRTSAANLLKRFPGVDVSAILTEMAAFIESSESDGAAFTQREHPSEIRCGEAALATIREMQKNRRQSGMARGAIEKLYVVDDSTVVDMGTVAASVWTAIGTLSDVPLGARRERQEALVLALADCLAERDLFHCAPGQAQRLLLVVDQQLPEVSIEQPDAPAPPSQFLTGAFYSAGHQLGADPSDQEIQTEYNVIYAEARKIYTGKELAEIRDGVSSFVAVTYDIQWYADPGEG